jgi:hypothetical protein
MQARLAVGRTRSKALTAVGFNRGCYPPVNTPLAHPELVALFTSMLQKAHLLVPFGPDEELLGHPSQPFHFIISAADLDLYTSFMARSPAHLYADTYDMRLAQPLLQHIYTIRTVPASLNQAWDIFHGNRGERALDCSEWSDTIDDAREVRSLFACLMDTSWESFMSSLSVIETLRGWSNDLGPDIYAILSIRPWTLWVWEPLLQDSDDEIMEVPATTDEGGAEITRAVEVGSVDEVAADDGGA